MVFLIVLSRTENPCVECSIHSLPTLFFKHLGAIRGWREALHGPIVPVSSAGHKLIHKATMPPRDDWPLRYGEVFIVAGRWRGRRGYYDDDEGPYCIVYPHGVNGYVLVRPSSLVEAPEEDESIH